MTAALKVILIVTIAAVIGIPIAKILVEMLSSRVPALGGVNAYVQKS